MEDAVPAQVREYAEQAVEYGLVGRRVRGRRTSVRSGGGDHRVPPGIGVQVVDRSQLSFTPIAATRGDREVPSTQAWTAQDLLGRRTLPGW